MNYADFEIMKKYRFGRVLDEQDRYVVGGLESIGWMKTGWNDNPEKLISFETNEVVKETASLTKTGAEFHYWERVRRNPLRRFWCNLIHSF